MYKVTDPDVFEHLRNAPGDTITIEVTQPGTIHLKLVRDSSAAFLVVEPDSGDEEVALGLWKSKHNPSKAETRDWVDRAIAEYRANGGQITTVAKGERRYTPRELKRIRLGLRVATPEEVEAERDRRAMVALRNKDVELATRILTKQFDREIRFDIEEDRIGPNGEIKNPAPCAGRNAVK